MAAQEQHLPLIKTVNPWSTDKAQHRKAPEFVPQAITGCMTAMVGVRLTAVITVLHMQITRHPALPPQVILLIAPITLRQERLQPLMVILLHIARPVITALRPPITPLLRPAALCQVQGPSLSQQANVPQAITGCLTVMAGVWLTAQLMCQAVLRPVLIQAVLPLLAPLIRLI